MSVRESRILDTYRTMDESDLLERIGEKKREVGDRILVLVHHYQKPEIVGFADHVGDSLELARIASEKKDIRFIVFCGVHFMAESARILADPEQVVVLPDLTAGCPLADSAEIHQVEEAWSALTGVCGDERIIPVTYVNSDALLKAFTGRQGGAVCTSSNAPAVFDWAVENGQKVFFFPDEHLGRNTARDRGFTGEDVLVWDPDLENGGNTVERIRRASVVLWKGYCHVHTWFKPEHVREVRRRDPGASVVAHPECPEEVIDLVDAKGSTGFIVQYVEKAPAGAHIAIATEIHLIKRLAKNHPSKKVYEVARSLCPNMYRIGLDDLCCTLEHLGEMNVIEVSNDIVRDARVALERMLRLV